VTASFDSIDWELMLKAVRRHTVCPWEFPHIPFERYADDAICHCRSAARALWSALGHRLAACKLVLHPVKTKVVYCKEVNRRGDFPVISFDFLGFQFRARKTMWRKGETRIFTHSFQPAPSPKALTRISRDARGWALHKRSDKSLTDLAEMYNPCIRGWITYYSHFYKTQLRPTLKRRRLCHQVVTPQVQAHAPSDQGGKRLVRPVPPSESQSPRPLVAVPWQRPDNGSHMNREIHVRFWESPEVKVLQATRQNPNPSSAAARRLWPAADSCTAANSSSIRSPRRRVQEARLG